MRLNGAEKTMRKLFSLANIEINGNNPWDIKVNNQRFYRRVLSKTALGLGESYMDGWWDCEALDKFFNRVLRAKLEERFKGNWKILLHTLKAQLLQSDQ